MLSEHTSDRAIAARLAKRLMVEEDPAAVCRILEEEKCIAVSQPTALDHTTTESATPRRVGIWEAREEGGETWFVRCNELDMWGLWARCERISARSSKTRIILLGESVARGFLYDPHYNCAAALQEALGKSFGDDVEVVDLAQTGASYSQVLKIAEAAAILHPNGYVVFAGNNWLVPGGISLPEAAEVLNKGEGWGGVQRLIQDQVRSGVSEFARSLGQLSRQQSIPIVFVIPEFNVDWRAYLGWEAPILGHEERCRWRQLLAEAQSALARQDFERAAALAQAMTKIDEGASPVALEIEAEAARALGHVEDARRLMDDASNSSLCLPVPKKDRCSAVLRDVLRKELPLHGVAVADFPAICREFLGGPLPDARLFLDYCHLTAEGIRLAMACAAEVLAPRMGRPFQSWSQLMDLPTAVEAKAEAQARFSAAVMAAICGQAENTICRYLDEAICLAPEMLDLSLLVAEAQIRRMPLLLCDAFDKLLAVQKAFPSISRLAYDPPNKAKELNLPLIHAIREVASTRRPEVQSIINDLLLQEHSSEGSNIDLLEPAYCDLSPFSHVDYGWWESSAYLTSHEYESRFRLFCSRPNPFDLGLTYRTPKDPGASEEPGIWLNGHKVRTFPLAPSWKTIHFRLLPEALRRGLNTLAIRWPEPTQVREKQTASIVSKMRAAISRHSWSSLPEIYPVYGEIFSFVAWPVLVEKEWIEAVQKSVEV